MKFSLGDRVRVVSNEAYFGCIGAITNIDPSCGGVYYNLSGIPYTWNEDDLELVQEEADESKPAKADSGKLEIDLVPRQIIKDIAAVRMYGTEKYGDPDNWKQVELRRYVNALLRHTLSFLDDPGGVDEESGLPHHAHMACNMAFICEMMGENWENGDGE